MWRISSDFITVLTRYIDKYLLGCNPANVLVVFFVLFTLCYRIRKRIHISLASVFMYTLYFTAVIAITLLGRKLNTVQNSAATLLATYHAWIIENRYWVIYEIIFNIIMFIPMGVIVISHANGLWKGSIYLFLFSFIIEILQLITGTGLFEICDLIDNTIGGMIGIGMVTLFRMIYMKKGEVS